MPQKAFYFSCLALFILLCSSLINVSWADSAWSKTYGGPNYEYAFSVTETSDGGYVLAGCTNSYGEGLYDVWLVKTDAYGNMEWNQTYGSTNQDCANSVAATPDGGYVLAGYRNQSRDMVAPKGDAWLIKTDTYGNLAWNKTYGGPNDDYVSCLLVAPDGGYIMAGSTDSYGAGLYDVWLIKTDAYGNMEWNRTYGGANYDKAYSLVRASDGGYAIAGTTSEGVLGGFRDVLLIKTDAMGNLLWNKTYGGTGYQDAGSLIACSDGGYAIAGEKNGAGLDFWLFKTDASGDLEWSQTYGGSSSEYAFSLVGASDGGYVLAGGTDSSGAGNTDAWLVKTDALGNVERNETFGGPNYDYAYSLCAASDGEFVMAGYTESFGAGASDAWLVKTEGYKTAPEPTLPPESASPTPTPSLSQQPVSPSPTAPPPSPSASPSPVPTPSSSSPTTPSPSIPEFPSWTFLSLTMATVLVAVIIAKRNRTRQTSSNKEKTGYRL